MTAPALSMTLLWILVGLAAIWDVAQRRIPNPLILVGLVLGAGFGAQAGGFAGLGSSVVGMAVGLAVLIAPFAARLLGGGDVKLVMVVGAFLGWRGVLHVILIGAIAHGAVAVLWLLGRGLARQLGRPVAKDPGIPHAVAYALATLTYTLGAVHLF